MLDLSDMETAAFRLVLGTAMIGTSALGGFRTEV